MYNLVTLISSMILVGSPAVNLSTQTPSLNEEIVSASSTTQTKTLYPDFFSLNWTGNLKGYVQLKNFSLNEEVVFDYQISTSKPLGFDARKLSVVISSAEKIPAGLNFELTTVDENGFGQIILIVDENFIGSEYAMYNFTIKVKYEDKTLINSDKAITLEGFPKDSDIGVSDEKKPEVELPEKEDSDKEMPEIELPTISIPELPKTEDKNQENIETDKDTDHVTETGQNSKIVKSTKFKSSKHNSGDSNTEDIKMLPQTNERSSLIVMLMGMILVSSAIGLIVFFRIGKRN